MEFKQRIDLGLLLLRLFFGAAMIFGHGWGKLMRFFGNGPIIFSDPIGVGMEISLGLVVFAELVCAFLVLLGFLTRWVVIPLILAMLVAAFIAHGGDPFVKMEKALMYLVVFFVLFLTGPGKYSIDALRK